MTANGAQAGLRALLAVSALVLAGSAVQAQTPNVAKGFATIDEPTALINAQLASAWKDNKLQPAERCSDYDFIRRASLDLIGRIATVREIDRFLKDPPATRRGLLLERLIHGDHKKEFTAHWANLWTIWLVNRAGADRDRYRKDLRPWLERTLAADTQSYKAFVEKLLTAQGKSDGDGSVNFLLAHLGPELPAAAKRAQDGQFDAAAITSRSVRLFLGYQIQCTQCHDHPFNADWKQKHFWGVNVFFRQLERSGSLLPLLAPVQEVRDNPTFNQKGVVFYEKRNGVFLPTDAVFVDGRKPSPDSKLVRREELARFVTSHKNFNRAIVNRLWGHFFGRGLNVKSAYDDFGEHNEVVHEELLTKLGEQFAGTGSYDLRKLMLWICSSDAYNLQPIANKTNAGPEAEPYFSRMPTKMMSPEQLLDSVITATRPVEDLKDNALVNFLYQALRDDWMKALVRNFGDDEGNEVTYNGTILQALLMMNSGQLNGAIGFGSGTVKEAEKIGATDKTGKKTVDYLFLATLNRPATAAEFTQLMRRMPLANGKIKSDSTGAMQDLFWALLNCNEFLLNH